MNWKKDLETYVNQTLILRIDWRKRCIYKISKFFFKNNEKSRKENAKRKDRQQPLKKKTYDAINNSFHINVNKVSYNLGGREIFVE